jgi:topoisomerase IA-like protein
MQAPPYTASRFNPPQSLGGIHMAAKKAAKKTTAKKTAAKKTVKKAKKK